ncbi:MAG: hypothetical protein IH608_13185 [Proteobacteria bacterium]|nr:hypothetical protein [Pseudomonadota bacterium]
MAVDREKLYEEVWAEPMTKVAARYHVSSSFLARVCERLNVPRPPRGYWARVKAGNPPKQPPLPQAQPGDELEWARDRAPRRMPRALPKAPQGKSRTRVRYRAERPSLHELLVGARERFEEGREKDGYLQPRKRLLVDVFVSKDTLPRALDVVNELFLAFEDRGHTVAFAPRDQYYPRPEVDERLGGGRERHYHTAWSPARPTVVFIGTVAFGLTLFELSEEVEFGYYKGKSVRVEQIPLSSRRGAYSVRTWTHKEDVPSGRLCLRAFSPYSRAPWEQQWREAKPGDLPGKIPRVIKVLRAQAAPLAKLVEEGERQTEIERQRWEEQHQQWLREEAERKRIRDRKESREELFAIVEAWGVAKRIEAFFEDAERRATDLGAEQRQLISDRLHGARELLGGVDALQRFLAWRPPEER